MGVSRAALREALRALELLGILKSVPGGGNYITEDLETWLIGPLSVLFQLNNGRIRTEPAASCRAGKRKCHSGS